MKEGVGLLCMMIGGLIGLYLMFAVAQAQWAIESESFFLSLNPLVRLIAMIEVLVQNWMFVGIGLVCLGVAQTLDEKEAQ